MNDIIHYTDLVLHTEAKEYEFNNSIPDPDIISSLLHQIKKERNGIGLAAPQIGIPLAVFAIGTETIFNPQILGQSKETCLMVEGCLSYPGVYLQVRRASSVQVKYQNKDGLFQTHDLEGTEARVFQHEFDHLKGLTFTDQASKLKLKLAVEHANKHGFDYSLKDLKNV